MLYLIGIGLSDEKDITVKGLEAVKSSEFIYIENYTSALQIDFDKLTEFYGKKVIPANRDLVENTTEIIDNAKEDNVSFCVIGDALSATTHTDLITRAKEKNINVKIIHNASVLTAVSETGLQLYKFGKVTSMPFFLPNYEPKAPYEILRQNRLAGAHTLVLLDLSPKDNEYLTIKKALEQFEIIESKEKLGLISEKIIACARLGCNNQKIVYDTKDKLKDLDFGRPPYCLVFPGSLHFAEEEFLNFISK